MRIILLILFSVALPLRCQDTPRWLCVGKPLGSCYLAYQGEEYITYSEAEELCLSHGGSSSLAVFPFFQEREIIYQVLTLHTMVKINKEPPSLERRFWVGLRFNHSDLDSSTGHDMSWFYGPSKLTSPAEWIPTNRFPIDSSHTNLSEGCGAAAVIKVNYNVTTDLQKLPCTDTAQVKGYLCEKADDYPGLQFWGEWTSWPPSPCQGENDTAITRQRLCLSHNCEIDVNSGQVEVEILACCPKPPKVELGSVIKEYRSTNGRAVESNTAELRCFRGHVEPATRHASRRYTCTTGADGEGLWSPPFPTKCEISDCGSPPLGVHAHPPEFTGTTYSSVATYFCHTGFKETKYNKTSVSLMCGDSDTWIGLDSDPDTRANCEPISQVVMEWIHYPKTADSGTDHCYRLHHQGLNWQDAYQQCNGGMLYTENSQEFEFIKQEILDPQEERSVIWLAGKKEKSASFFSWRLKDGRHLNITGFTNWVTPGPLLNEYHRDLCVAITYSDGLWKWINATCDNKFEFICKTMEQKIDGGWSEWTQWTACNRGLVRTRNRKCNTPSPFCGGAKCAGKEIEESLCCADPGQAPYTSISYRSITNESVFLLPGHYFTYQCWFGYEHTNGASQKNITCQMDGKWTDPGYAPACTPKRCPNPENGTHSFVSPLPSGIYEHGVRVSYDCENGFGTTKDAFASIGAQIACVDGSWAEPPLVCYAKSCADSHPQLTLDEYRSRHINPSYVRTADVISHASWGWDARSNGTDLYLDNYRYFCEFGYKTPRMKVDYNITCYHNGAWWKEVNFEDAHPLSCEPVECPGPPPQPQPNSIWIGGVSPNQASYIGTYLDEATYSCNRGYQVKTDIHGDERVLLNYTYTCGANNGWTDEFSPKQCVKQSCGDPGNGSFVEYRVADMFLYLDRVDYICKQGYAYNSTVIRRRLVCDLRDGSPYVSWNGTELVCEKVVCENPGQGKNARRIGDNFEYNDVILFVCNPQHVLVGGGVEKLWLRCTSQGQWNGTAAACEVAEISSDFGVHYVKPYAVMTRWIVSEKYQNVLCSFNIAVLGRPGYIDEDGNPHIIPEFPTSAIDDRVETYTSAESGIVKFYVWTRPEYIYDFKLESRSEISTEPWPEDLSPINIFTHGGPPFLGNVQRHHLPRIIPLYALPKARTMPIVMEITGVFSAKVTLDRRMFSEENGTIIGFTVIVKEVHPFHNSEKLLAAEGYHNRYPNRLYTYQELESIDKYTSWPPYFALPLCNMFDNNNNASCDILAGPRPSDVFTYPENFTMTNYTWSDSIYGNFSNFNSNPDQKVTLSIGLMTNCSVSKENSNYTCNGPLRQNRRFCVKLRAYTRYGWNDSLCSDIIEVVKVLEFDDALILPTILAITPFAAMFLGIFMCNAIPCKETDEMIDADFDEVEGELIKSWSYHGSILSEQSGGAKDHEAEISRYENYSNIRSRTVYPKDN